MWPYTPDEAEWLALRTDPDSMPAAPTKTPLAAPAETQDCPDDDRFIAA